MEIISYYDLMGKIKNKDYPKFILYDEIEYSLDPTDKVYKDNFSISLHERIKPNQIFRRCISYNKELLTEQEKTYLFNLISPFREQFDYLFKGYDIIEKEQSIYYYIKIKLKDNNYLLFTLPETDLSYKGLEFNIAYHLKELNL